MKKAAAQEAEKPALSSTAAEKAAAVEAKNAAQLAEESLRSMQSPNHKALSAWQTSESVDPLAPAALEAGKAVSVAEKVAAMSAVENSPDKRPASFNCLEDWMQSAIQRTGLTWGAVTLEDMKRLYPQDWQGLKGLTDDAKFARRESTMNNSAVPTPRQQCARHLRNTQVHRVHALQAQIQRLQAQVKQELAQMEFN